MNIVFYIDEMNLRGLTNSTFSYAYYNQKILKNKSIIFYNKKNYRNMKEALILFKNHFKVFGIKNFKEIENYKENLKIDYIYVQKGGNKDIFVSQKINTLVHAIFPQNLDQIHGYNYAFVSNWLSKKFSNGKIQYIPLIVENYKTNQNLRHMLGIKKNQIVFGCHGGSSSFDLEFVKNAISKAVKERNNISFLFLNIDKFTEHPRIIFLNGTMNKKYKRKFLNTCDAMIYGRSLGESFGLACAEFAILGKKIISYKYNRHRNHIYSLNKKQFMEYNSFQNLLKILFDFKKDKEKELVFNQHKYLKYNPGNVMKIFKNNFLIKKKKIKITIYDKFINLVSRAYIFYNYINHKIYNHYYKYIYWKFYNYFKF